MNKKHKNKHLFWWLSLIIIILIIINIFVFEKPDFFAPKPVLRKPVIKPQIAIIIDDLGYDKRHAKILYKINKQITLAIIPHQAYSAQMAKNAVSRGQEVLIHLPMEPHNYKQYGKLPNMLLESMGVAALKEKLKYQLEDIPQAVGVNNHMGSLLTEDKNKMTLILMQLKKRRLFFIDSRTSHDTKAYITAKKLDIKSAKRDIFLDNENNLGAISKQLKKLVLLAKQSGKAIAIGHPRKKTFSALKKFVQTDSFKQVQLVVASKLVD